MAHGDVWICEGWERYSLLGLKTPSDQLNFLKGQSSTKLLPAFGRCRRAARYVVCSKQFNNAKHLRQLSRTLRLYLKY